MISIHSTIRSVAVVAAVLVLTGACSSIPDAASPAHWYRSTVDYFSGDDKEKGKSPRAPEKRKAAQPATGGANDESKPTVAAVPAPTAEAKPATLASESTSASEVSERIARPSNRGLLADTGGPRPRYAPAVSRQADDSGVPPSRAQAATTSVPGGAEPPPPVSAPRAPVSATSAPAPTPAADPASRPEKAREAAPLPAAPTQPAEARRSPPPRDLAARAAPPPAPETPARKSEPAPPAPTASAASDRKPVSVDEAYRASLARQSQLPATAEDGRTDDPGTMVISSEGIETARRVPSALMAEPTEQAEAKTEAAAGGKSLGRFLDATPGKSAGGGKLVRVATVQFADGSAKLDAEAREILAQVAKLQREKGGIVRVVGHASMRTRPMDLERHGKVNAGISAARANAVVQQLTRLGVKREATAVDALGDSDPIYFEVMGTGEAGNRRAEIYMEF